MGVEVILEYLTFQGGLGSSEHPTISAVDTPWLIPKAINLRVFRAIDFNAYIFSNSLLSMKMQALDYLIDLVGNYQDLILS